MSICMTIFCSPIKLRKSGFMVKWQEKPGLGMLNHISHIYIYIYYTMDFMQGQGLAKSLSHAHV